MAKGYNVSYADRTSEVEKIRYWQDAYWNILFNRGYAPGDVYPIIHERDQLREINHKQASTIMHLELLLGCIRRVGDTTYIDARRIQELYRFYEDTKPYIRQGLTTSKYYRKP